MSSIQEHNDLQRLRARAQEVGLSVLVNMVDIAIENGLTIRDIQAVLKLRKAEIDASKG